MARKTNFDQEQITNDGKGAVVLPYRVNITIEGVAPICGVLAVLLRPERAGYLK